MRMEQGSDTNPTAFECIADDGILRRVSEKDTLEEHITTGATELKHDSYFHWLTSETLTKWWHDSGDPEELRFALGHKACGVTTNPVLIYKTLSSQPELWADGLRNIDPDMPPLGLAENRVKTVVQNAAREFESQHERSCGEIGYVCAQVCPGLLSDRDGMLDMARRFNRWAPNIAVKLPATLAGLDVLEECISEGITIAATVSFTVSQVLAIAERHRKGIERAAKEGKSAGRCFAVIMIGRIDDYLREVAHDRKLGVTESDIQQAGLAISKRAYSIYKERNYETTLLVAALRGTYHMEGLAGAELIMSVHPKYQAMLLEDGVSREVAIDQPVATDAIERLMTVPEFVRAYEPDGMAEEDFLTFGATQKTLSQFNFAGWVPTESL